MKPVGWPCPLPHGGTTAEPALACDRGRALRLLVIPALFDEANKLRRLTVEVMRRLDAAGIDCFLPDLPGCNESALPLEAQTPQIWRESMAAAARHFQASHVLAIRGGALLTPGGLPGWHYAPAKGASLLRQMLRARILAAREAGRDETPDGLMEMAALHGLELAGYRLSGSFLTQMQSLLPPVSVGLSEIEQAMVGGGGLWLRAEPDDDRAQADTLAAIIAVGMKN